MTTPAATGTPAGAAPLAPPVAPTFVYHDLMTTDAERARRFYGALLPWELTPRDVSGVPYTDIRVAGAPFGGIMPLDPAHGIPSHWMSYVQVADLDAACARVAPAGGTVRLGPHPIPDGSGRFAILQDPTGAYVSLLQMVAPLPSPDVPAPGGAWWHELITPDPVRAGAFYAAVVGWTVEDAMTMPDGSRYRFFKAGDRNVGGLMACPPGAPPVAAWQLYVALEEVAAVMPTVAHAQRLGATVAWPVMDVPGVGRMAGIQDPTGAHLALGAAEMPAPDA